MELAQHHTDWILAVFGIVTLILLSARAYNQQRFKEFSFLPFHSSRQELENSFNPVPGKGFVDFSMSLASPVVLALACYILLHPYHQSFPVFSDWALFLRLLFMITGFFLLKNLLGMLVGWVFDSAEEIAEAQNVYLAYRSWAAIVLLPLCIIVVYVPQAYPVLYYLLLISLIIASYVALQFAALRIWKMTIAGYYKIFYLCALEITPLIFLIGWLVSLAD